jgi:TolB protein
LKYFNDPAFSPDGEKIAFRGGQFASKREKGFIDEIYVMNADGSGIKKVTSYPVQDSTAAWYDYKAGPPRWHPTENFISFSSFQNGKYSLYGVTADGTKQWKLTNNTEGEVYHDWSPDGKWLVTDLSNEDGSQYHIGLVNWETKQTKILTDTTFVYQQAPVFVKIFD